MVKSKTRRDAEILVRNPSPRLFGKKFRDSKEVNTNHAKTRLRDLSKTLPRLRDHAKIFRDPRFSRYHSPPLLGGVYMTPGRLSRRDEFTPVPSHGSTFVYMIPPQKVMPGREFHPSTKSRNRIM